MLKYLRIATHDFHGAGSASVSVVQNLRKYGVDAKLLVQYKKSSYDYVIGVHDYHSFWGKFLYISGYAARLLYRKLFVVDSKYLFLDLQRNSLSADKILKLYGDIPDVISCAWTSNFISNKTIRELKEKTGAKVMIEMTDDSPLTGGCHYPWDCRGYTSECYPCPALRKGCRKAQKTLLFKKENITPDMMISGTTNDCLRAKASTIYRNNKIIPTVYLPKNPYSFPKSSGLEKWGIPEGNYVIFCGAKDLSEERKGFRYLIEALEFAKETIADTMKITLLVAARDLIDFPTIYDVRVLGLLGEEDLYRAYCCADLFVCTSVEDSGPLMINQAFMANTPVLAFKMGVALDLIEHKKNGYIANLKDSVDLCNGLIWCYSHNLEIHDKIIEVNSNIANYCREHKMAGKYLGL